MFHNSFIFETRNIREAARMLTNEDLKRLRMGSGDHRLGRLLGQHPHQRNREVDSADVRRGQENRDLNQIFESVYHLIPLTFNIRTP